MICRQFPLGSGLRASHWRKIALCLAFFCLIAAAGARRANAFVLEGSTWPEGTQIAVQFNLGSAPRPLLDGSTSWNVAVAPVLDMWNEALGKVQFTGSDGPTGSAHSGDRLNSIAFAKTYFGNSFGKYTLAVTYYLSSNSTLIEADVLFNEAMAFDSYRGPLRFPSGGGIAIADIRRVLLHELGHAIGLDHPDQAGQQVEAVMNATISDQETLAHDDIAGAQRLYGAPNNPTPTPTPKPTPAPTASPPANGSHIANISTRMDVGIDENVLIGGFIVKGSQPKKLMLRAIGPSLTAAGVAGALSDPTLELHSADGRVVASNDDWQTGTQAAQIEASGVAPVNLKESALITTVPAGSYTAVVKGRDGAQGIAIVEAYELDANSTRLVNISTRGRIGAGDRALIGGLIVQGSTAKKVIIRGIGPSLAKGGISGALANPTLELHDGAGNLINANDDWNRGPQAAEINASGVPPEDPLESAIIARLAPGSFTAVVRGANDATGIGMVEVFDLQP